MTKYVTLASWPVRAGPVRAGSGRAGSCLESIQNWKRIRKCSIQNCSTTNIKDFIAFFGSAIWLRRKLSSLATNEAIKISHYLFYMLSMYIYMYKVFKIGHIYILQDRVWIFLMKNFTGCERRMHLLMWIYILIPYWMVRPSVILSVRYRNHFPFVQFQNQAHIWNPRGTGHIFKTIWGAPGTPRKGCQMRPKFGAPMAPQIFFLLFLSPPKAA